jgi:ATP-binding cassette subfamily F protein 2
VTLTTFLLTSEKAAKAAANGSSKGTTTTASSTNGTPMTNMSANTSVDNLDMKKLELATDRNASGVLTSDKQSRDIHIDNFTMSFHGRLLVDGASVVLNYGQR